MACINVYDIDAGGTTELVTNGWMGLSLWRLGRDKEAISHLDTAIALGYVNARRSRALEHIDNAEFEDAHQLLTVWARNQGIETDWVRVYIAAIKNPARGDEASPARPFVRPQPLEEKQLAAVGRRRLPQGV